MLYVHYYIVYYVSIRFESRGRDYTYNIYYMYLYILFFIYVHIILLYLLDILLTTHDYIIYSTVVGISRKKRNFPAKSR